MSQDKFQQYMTKARITNEHAHYFFKLRDYNQAWQGLKHCLHNLSQALKYGYDDQILHDLINLHTNYVNFGSAIMDSTKCVADRADVAIVLNEVTNLHNRIYAEFQTRHKRPTSNITSSKIVVPQNSLY